MINGIMKRVEDRTSKELKTEILDLFAPLKDRLSGAGYVRFNEQRVHYLEVVQKLEELMYDQEIEKRTNDAVEDFMSKVDKLNNTGG